MEKILEKLRQKENLTFDESKSAFELLMTGKASEDEIYSFLTLLSEKGEVSDEIAGGVYVLREKSKRVNVSDCVDTCGTGGDGMNTLAGDDAGGLDLGTAALAVVEGGSAVDGLASASEAPTKYPNYANHRQRHGSSHTFFRVSSQTRQTST